MWVGQNKMAPSVTQPYRKLRAKNEATHLRREQVFWKTSQNWKQGKSIKFLPNHLSLPLESILWDNENLLQGAMWLSNKGLNFPFYVTPQGASRRVAMVCVQLTVCWWTTRLQVCVKRDPTEIFFLKLVKQQFHSLATNYGWLASPLLPGKLRWTAQLQQGMQVCVLEVLGLTD